MLAFLLFAITLLSVSASAGVAQVQCYQTSDGCKQKLAGKAGPLRRGDTCTEQKAGTGIYFIATCNTTFYSEKKYNVSTCTGLPLSTNTFYVGNCSQNFVLSISPNNHCRAQCEPIKKDEPELSGGMKLCSNFFVIYSIVFLLYLW